MLNVTKHTCCGYTYFSWFSGPASFPGERLLFKSFCSHSIKYEIRDNYFSVDILSNDIIWMVTCPQPLSYIYLSLGLSNQHLFLLFCKLNWSPNLYLIEGVHWREPDKMDARGGKKNLNLWNLSKSVNFVTCYVKLRQVTCTRVGHRHYP